MNTGAFGEGFPYGNFHDLNMDWIIKIAKDFLDQYTNIQQTITDGLEGLDNKAQELETLLQQWYDTHSEDIANQLADSLQDLNDWYNEHQGYLNEYLTDSITAFNTSAEAKARETIESIPDDYTALSNDVSELESACADIAKPGKNMFNYRKSVNGKYIEANGTETTHSGLSHSEYIPVKSEQTIYVNIAIGSNTFPNIVQFDESFHVIANGTIYRSSASAFSFETATTAKYIILNYVTTDTQLLIVSDVDSTFEAFKYVGTGNVSQYNLYSDNYIYYDGTYLKSKSDMYLMTFKGIINIGQSVNVGNGRFLYYNENTGNLTASNNAIMSKDIYIVQPLINKPRCFSSYTSDSISIVYDAINNSVVVSRNNGYIYSNGTYYSTSGLPVTLQSNTPHFLIYYKISDDSFNITSSYNSITNDCVVLMEADRGYYNSICPVKIINGQYALADKKLYTFGDSLTWYNLQNFTWGEHEGEQCIGFQTFLTRYVRMDLKENYGSSGATTPKICEILKNHISNISDDSVVTIMGGDNDDRLGVSLGTLQPVGGTFDTNTIYGSLQDAIETLLTSKPTVRIVMMTEPMGWTYTNGTMKRVSELIPEAYRRVAHQYGLPLIDLWNDSGINELTRNTYYADPTPATNQLYMYHPNNDGWERLSRIICREIMKV